MKAQPSNDKLREEFKKRYHTDPTPEMLEQYKRHRPVGHYFWKEFVEETKEKEAKDKLNHGISI